MRRQPDPRNQLPAAERDARSRLRQCADRPLLRGSLVRMARVCGKPGCHCVQGEKHVSLYLAIRVGRKRKMIYLPSRLEERARAWVASSQEIDRLLELVSQSCLEALLRDKGAQAARGTPPRKRRSSQDRPP
jgi:uncharacterized protein DUF6788